MKLLFAFLFLFGQVFQLLAAVELPSVISSGMVLQRDLNLPIWGWGKPGDKVKVSFAGQIQRTEVDAKGNWQVRFSPLKASSENRMMKIEVGSESVELKDVVVGEVWVCSGQSNMQFSLAGGAGKTVDPKHQPIADWMDQERKTANDPLIRQIATPNVTSYDKEKKNFEGKWISADSEANNNNFTAVGYFFAKELRRELNVPVGLLKCPWGGKQIQPFIPSTQYKSDAVLSAYYQKAQEDLEKAMKSFDPDKAEAKYQKDLEKWKQEVQKAKDAGSQVPKKPNKATAPQLNPNFPSTLYNSMVNPLVPFGIRGALWYQGESNANTEAGMYGKFIEALATGWRNRWGQGDFPLYYCQLASFRDAPTKPVVDDNWVTVCDQMRRTLTFKHTGMAVLNDIGEAKDIHPRNKLDAGKRLALWALAKDYGRTDLVYSGPLYKSHTINGNKVMIQFDSVGEGLMIARKNLLDPAEPVSEPLRISNLQPRRPVAMG